MKRILGALTQQAVPIEGNSNNDEMEDDYVFILMFQVIICLLVKTSQK